MKNTTKIVSLIAAATMAIISTHATSAQDGLLERGKDLMSSPGSSGGATSALGGATGGSVGKIVDALPMDTIKALLEKQGYTKISNLIPTSSGDALQASAVNKSGSPVDLLVNPKTGQVLKQVLLKK
jgi:hypothetical protein